MGTGKVSLCLATGFLAWIASAGAWAQQAPGPNQDPITPDDCLREQHKASQCQALGLRYVTGNGVAQDTDKGMELLGAACHAGLPSGCMQQGWFLLKNSESPQDVQTGLELIEKTCRAGDAQSCAALGSVYADGIGVPRDVPKGVKILEKACALDGALACQALGTLLSAGDGVEPDATRAQALMVKACQLGRSEACVTACADGDGGACVSLGLHLSRARNPDEGRIAHVYRLGCDAGVAQGCHLLALRINDAAQAFTLSERACTLGLAAGCARAGRAQYLGLGVAVDLAAAVRFYAAACEKGEACGVLGAIYARGELGADAVPQGQALLRKACGEDVECQAILANGRIPQAWGGSLDALRPSATATKSRAPVRVGAGIAGPRKIKDARPIYPPVARNARIQGTVAMECVIDATGAVRDIRVVGSVPLLDAAAVAAVRQWRYEPTLIEGEPVPVIMFVTVNFRIS